MLVQLEHSHHPLRHAIALHDFDLCSHIAEHGRRHAGNRVLFDVEYHACGCGIELWHPPSDADSPDHRQHEYHEGRFVMGPEYLPELYWVHQTVFRTAFRVPEARRRNALVHSSQAAFFRWCRQGSDGIRPDYAPFRVE